ncbi:MAG: membrane-bound O-acyltransferase family protein [Flavobacteriaceae bacterium CG_4_9_14_0_8_um_filter_34_30]|nr:MBOAT family protein [Flavobacteriia bacterium]PIZ07613.1 MAG: membrane-bound O-acyltransferase family protein [Flavobacteriaceae bacterium CG_4_10_14_0_8_um_filter_34_31]PJC07384.1 MAG: membrane-bound O-acyltransferase family protein [Flavobacteriaceae bacterium CG_4_9_14_0_8_um_filter_34_30]
MLFNTVDFAIFFPLVLLLYWTVFKKNITLQNSFLIVVSYLFYSFWDWRFLSLIFMSSLLDFIVGYYLGKTSNNQKRKLLLAVSLFFNLGVLAVFKYFNFFVEPFIETFALFGSKFESTTWSIILPVGISFYTFQTLSYTIDIYRGRILPTKNIISFFAFVSFFPQLVAGPIERASNLLSQFESKRHFDYSESVDGLRLILSGLFKKMVIADNCALLVNAIFANYQEASGSTLLLGAVFFGFQIYGDFSGYSDIAIGTSRLMGFRLMKNFHFPYLAVNVADFWRRWHISLSTWFRDYVYIPLGGNRVSKTKLVINIFIVFLLSGLWHGANLTFVFWGFIHALFVVPVIFIGTNNELQKSGYLPSLRTIFQIGITFIIVTLAWVFFRAETITDALQYLKIIFSESLFSVPDVPKKIVFFLFLYMAVEWLQRNRDHVLDIAYIPSKMLRMAIYYFIVFLTFYFAGDLQPFIYFQF